MSNQKLDEKLANVISEAINDYVSGKPWTGVSFDIWRVSPTPSMEAVHMLFMSQKDWKIIHPLMQILYHPKTQTKNKVLQTIVDALENPNIN